MKATRVSVVTPTPLTALKRARPLLLLIALLIVAFLVVWLAPREEESFEPLHPGNARDEGTRALVQVLRDHGVGVRIADSPTDAIARARQGATLVVVGGGNLNEEMQEHIRALPSVVIVGSEGLDNTFQSGITGATKLGVDATSSSSPTPECTSKSIGATSALTPVEEGVIVSSDDWVNCFPVQVSGDTQYGWTEKETESTWMGILSVGAPLTNQHIDEAGNAAFALTVMSRTGDIVWYHPTFEDSLAESPTPVPDWLFPSFMMVCAAGLVLAAAVGRRLGRLVPEDFPSVVPAIETVIGRGRLLRRAKDHAHAARALRIETAGRLASRLALPSGASGDALYDALTRRGIDPTRARELFWGATPTTDDGLVALSDDLSRLEKEISHD
ncbi:MAG: DUF4350 domain-containing protein [Actinomycetaceae bacterium]|nr:DUF4350 domain-containing protein [Actinomycetaceae bacterium]